MAAVVGKCVVHLQLIEAVREHEVLYNCDLKDYSDNILKMRLWRQIARKCDIATGEEAKKIWKNLRDGYRCSLKTLKIYENKEPPRPLKPWKYVEEMEFLRPFMKDRVFSNAAYYETDHAAKVNDDNNTMDSDHHVQSSVSSFSGGDTDVQEEIECRPDVTLLAQQELLNQLQNYDMKDDPEPGSVQNANDLTSQAMSQLEALAGLYQHPSLGLHPLGIGPAPAKRRGRKRKTEIDLVPQHHQPMAMNQTQKNQMDSEEDTNSLKLFFDSMYAATKSLPVSLQRLIRITLFKSVTNAEMIAESMTSDLQNLSNIYHRNASALDDTNCDK